MDKQGWPALASQTGLTRLPYLGSSNKDLGQPGLPAFSYNHNNANFIR